MALSVIASSAHRDLPTESTPLLSQESLVQTPPTSKLDNLIEDNQIIVDILVGSLVFLQTRVRSDWSLSRQQFATGVSYIITVGHLSYC